MTIVSVGSAELSTYELMLTIGILGMFWCAARRRSRYRMNALSCGLFALILTLTGVAGAMGMYYLETGAFGGVSFFGSVFLIPVLMPLLGLLFRLKPGETLDLCAPCVAIMIGCMRFNCFLSGCCGGWQMCVGSLCFAWPTQMLESIGDFAILLWLLKKETQEYYSGRLYPLFLISYSTMRFTLEFLRDTPKDWLYLSHGQWFSLVAVIAGVLWGKFVVVKRRNT